MLPQIEEICVGNYILVPAPSDRRWSYHSAQVWGVVTEVCRLDDLSEPAAFKYRLSGESGTHSVTASHVLQFEIIQPQDFIPPITSEMKQHSITTAKRAHKRNRRYDESDEDEDARSQISSTSIISAPKRSKVIVSTSTCNRATARAYSSRKFEYFPDLPDDPSLTVFDPVTKDMFCDDQSIPHERFEAQLLHKRAGWFKPLSLFERFLPVRFLESTVLACTSRELVAVNKQPLQLDELWVYIGLRLAMTLSPCEETRDFWSEDETFLRPAPRFGRWMSRTRFESITAALTFTADEREDDPIAPVREIYAAFNENMCRVFRPSWVVTVDESMVAWTAQDSMPHFVFVGRKPTPTGQECHDIACGLSSIIFVLDIVARIPSELKPFEDRYKATAALVLNLCNQSDLFDDRPRLLIGDSAFPSIELMKELKAHGIHSIFALKKQSGWRQGVPGDHVLFPLSQLELGNSVCLQSTRARQPHFFIAGLLDMNPCILMANASSMSVSPDAREQTRWTKAGATPKTTVKFKRPEVFEIYYRYRHAVDDANNLRQNARSIEYAWQTKTWIHRSFAFLLGVAEANAFNAYRHFASTTDVGHPQLSHGAFRRAICEEILKTQPLLGPGSGNRAHMHTTFRKDALWNKRSGRWILRPRNKTNHQVQRKCVGLTACDRVRVSHHCSCDPGQALCKLCWAKHVIDVKDERA